MPPHQVQLGIDVLELPLLLVCEGIHFQLRLKLSLKSSISKLRYDEQIMIYPQIKFSTSNLGPD